MRVLAFTKPFGRRDVGSLADAVAATGAEGADLVVRDGQTVTPDEPYRIGTVARALDARGLGLDVVTTDFLDATDERADHVLGACADAAVGLVRVGFYRYDPVRGYRAGFDDARRGLSALAELGAHHGVRVALQLHHGTVHPSAGLALPLLAGLDEVAVYADPGNQAKEGSEDWRLNLDLLGDRVACIGVKNAAWRETPQGWRCEFQPFTAGGVVPWPDIAAGLRDRDYTGMLSVHVHHEVPDVVDAVRQDIAHLRKLLS